MKTSVPLALWKPAWWRRLAALGLLSLTLCFSTPAHAAPKPAPQPPVVVTYGMVGGTMRAAQQVTAATAAAQPAESIKILCERLNMWETLVVPSEVNYGLSVLNSCESAVQNTTWLWWTFIKCAGLIFAGPHTDGGYTPHISVAATALLYDANWTVVCRVGGVIAPYTMTMKGAASGLLTTDTTQAVGTGTKTIPYGQEFI